jgi:hypothetical protein
MHPPERLLDALRVEDTASVPDIADWTANQIQNGQ